MQVAGRRDQQLPAGPQPLQELLQGLGNGRGAESQHEVGHESAGDLGVAQEGIVAVDDVRGVGPPAHLGQDVGEDRKTQRPCQTDNRIGEGGIVLRAAHNQAAPRAMQVAGQISRRCRGQGLRSLYDRNRGPGKGRARCAFLRRRDQRLAEGKIDVNRSGRGGHAVRDGAVGGRTNVPQRVAAALRQGHVDALLGVPPVELRLADGLGGPYFLQFRRPVGRQDQERHAAVERFRHRGCEV